MADRPEVKTSPALRRDIEQVFTESPRLARTIEDMINDVREILPDSVLQINLDLAALKAATYVTMGPSVTLLNERILTASPSIDVSDGGNVVTLILKDTGVTPGSYGSATAIPSFAVDIKGRLTAASSIALNTINLSAFGATTSAQLASVLTDETGTGKAVFSDSAALTGTPSAPTAAANTNTTQLATTAFVEGEFSTPPAAGFGSGTARPVAATTITASSTITPSQTAGIVGTTTNNNANAGSIGEYVSASASGVSMVSATPKTVTSMSLTAGDWDVSGVVNYVPTGTTSVTAIQTGTSTVNNTFGTFDTLQQLNFGAVVGSGFVQAAPVTRLSLATTTTIYLIGQVVFTASTETATGLIRARRVR